MDGGSADFAGAKICPYILGNRSMRCSLKNITTL